MAVHLWSWLVWALVGASAVFWALKLLDHPLPLPAHASVHGPDSMLQGDLTRLLVGERSAVAQGSEAEQQPAQSTDAARFQLVGVFSPPDDATTDARDQGGLALIAIDGKPPLVFAVGEVVDGQRVLLRVAQRRADIGAAGQPPQLSLVIPEPQVAAPGQGRVGSNAAADPSQTTPAAASASAPR